MCSVQEMQRVDRELSSELVESPINPAFLHMSVPLLNGSVKEHECEVKASDSRIALALRGRAKTTFKTNS